MQKRKKSRTKRKKGGKVHFLRGDCLQLLVLFDSIGTLGARDFSCAVSGFGQVLKSDPREKPLDQSAVPLIAPSQLQHRLYQCIQNLDVLLIGSLEISNISNALIGLQSQ